MRTDRKPWNDKLGKNIRKYRKAAKMSTQALAGACATRASEIEAYEDGRYAPAPWRLRLMADALAVSLDELFPPAPKV
jgi:transcriptional regulator with XRE-family HTH domain